MNPVSNVSISALDLALPLGPIEKGGDKTLFDSLGLDPVELVKRPEQSRIVVFVKAIFEKMQSFYHEHVPETIQSKISWIGKLGEKVGTLIDKIVKFVKGVFDGLRQASSAVSTTSGFSKLMGKLKILGALAVGGVIYNMVKNGKSLSKAIKNQENGDTVDASLLLVENVGDLASVGETIAIGLKEFGKIAATKTLETASNVLVGIGTILSLATVALNSKHWYETAKFRKELDAKFKGADGQETNFTDMIAHIDEQKPRKLKKMLGVKDGRVLKLRLQSILQKSQDCDEAESKEIIEKTTKAFKKRLVTKEIFHGLKILASVISIVASAVLLFTPVAPLAFAFLALSTAISISVLVADYFMDAQFEKALTDIVPDTSKLEIKVPPQRPEPLKEGATKGEKEQYEITMQKYHRDLVKHYEDQAQMNKEHLYSIPVEQYQWKKSGKTMMRKKIGKIIHWKPKPWVATEKNKGTKVHETETGTKLSSDSIKKITSHAGLQLADKEQIEAQGGMSFEAIRQWKPKDFALA